jgi:O-antigen/teichoic acid export membrane protein
VQGCRFMAMLAGAVAILIWVTGPPFLLLWTGKPLIVKTVPALGIMVAGTFVFLSHRLGGDLLFGLGLQGKIAVLELTEAVGIVGLTIPLSLKFGIAGAALGLAIPPVFVRGILQTRFVCQAIKLSFFAYYSKCILRSWLVLAVVLVLARATNLPQQVTGWPSLIWISALLLLLYMLFVYVLVLEHNEKRRLQEEVCGIVGWLRKLRAV